MGAAFSNNRLEAIACWWFEAFLALFQHNQTGDHSLIDSLQSESRCKQVQAGESRPKCPKTQRSTNKDMVSISWDTHDIIFIVYLEKKNNNWRVLCYITLSVMDFGTWPMITDFDRFYPVESESGDWSRELALVFERNGVKSSKKRVFGHFWEFLSLIL